MGIAFPLFLILNDYEINYRSGNLINNKIELNSLNLEDSIEFMVNMGEKSFRGEQLFSFFNRNKKNDINQLTVFSKELRKKVEEIGKINKIEILDRFDSKLDGTKKYLYLLEDNNIVEGVLMKYPHGYSICISTQVGCRMGCSFCASTKGGCIRNLSEAEMLNQIYLVEKDLGINISNIVLMGSGEPLDNYDRVINFLNIINDKKGRNISLRNISLSTCGLVPEIDKLAEENLPITLSISLHSPFDSQRSKIMPIAKKYSVKDLIEACRNYENKLARRITFEYTLIKDFNDRDVDIYELEKLLKGLNAHINVIPLNPIREYNEETPEDKDVKQFVGKLNNKGLNATIRKEKGLDISASCGQLKRNYLEK